MFKRSASNNGKREGPKDKEGNLSIKSKAKKQLFKDPVSGHVPINATKMERTDFVQDEPRIKSGPFNVKTKVKWKYARRKPWKAENGTRPANAPFVFPKLSPAEPVEEVD